jgi:hypothetical protein
MLSLISMDLNYTSQSIFQLRHIWEFGSGLKCMIKFQTVEEVPAESLVEDSAHSERLCAESSTIDSAKTMINKILQHLHFKPLPEIL